MRAVLQDITNAYKRQADITGVTAYINDTPYGLTTDYFDLLLIVVTTALGVSMSLSHYIRSGVRIQEIRIAPAQLERWLRLGHNRSILIWLLQGEILLDRDSYMERLRDSVETVPQAERDRKLLAEFSSFLIAFLRSKEYIQEDHVLDAYSNILSALHHYARIVIIEEGANPEVTVWKQVRKINLGVYKLYEELTLSNETLRERVELVQLACDFSVMSKLESCCAHLIRLLQERGEPWTIEQLESEVDDSSVHLPIVLDRLVRRALAREVAVPLQGDFSSLEICYTA